MALNKLLFLYLITFFVLIGCNDNLIYKPKKGSDKTFNISGNAELYTGGTPVIGGTVLLNGRITAQSTVDGSGEFSFENIPNGSYTLTHIKEGVVSLLQSGYNTITINEDSNNIDFYCYEYDEIYTGFNGEFKTISEIQGNRAQSIYNGLEVNNVFGVVVAVYFGTDVDNDEYQVVYIANPFPDYDIATSEGIRLNSSYLVTGDVFSVGDLLVIKSGVIEESIENTPGGSTYSENLPVTTIRASTTEIVKIGTGFPLPDPVKIGENFRKIPLNYYPSNLQGNDAGSIEHFLRPDENAIDFFESIEGMLVEVVDSVVTGGVDDYGAFYIAPDNGYNGIKTVNGGVLVGEDYITANPFNIAVSDRFIQSPHVKVGDRFESNVKGIICYDYERYKLLAVENYSERRSIFSREVSGHTRSDGMLTVCSFNVENHPSSSAPNGSYDKTKDIASIISYNLRSPDIISLIEVQDNSGNLDDGVVDCNNTLDDLIDAIHSFVDTDSCFYDYRQINPIYNSEGGEPGGNIRNVVLFNTKRVRFVDSPNDEELLSDPGFVNRVSTENVDLVFRNGKPALSINPGRIEPLNEVFNRTRKSLACEFEFMGEKVFVIVNHLTAKGGDDPLQGRYQPPERGSEVTRIEQSRVVADFIREILNMDPGANIISLGDFNDFHFSPALRVFEDVGLTNLIYKVPLQRRYSYNYEGNSQILDNMLVSSGMLSKLEYFDIIHTCSDYSSFMRPTDHDPIIGVFKFRSGGVESVVPTWDVGYPIFESKKTKIKLNLLLDTDALVFYAADSHTDVFTVESVRSGKAANGYAYESHGFFAVNAGEDVVGVIEGLLPNSQYRIALYPEYIYGGISGGINLYTETTRADSQYTATDLFISEYIEGGGYNKVIEIANFTGSTVDLSDYSLRRDSNGSGLFTVIQNLSGNLNHGDVFVACSNRSDCDPRMQALADALYSTSSSGVLGFSGNDQVALFKNGIMIDMIGVGGGVVFGKDKTFIRKDTVMSPSNSGNRDPRNNEEWSQAIKDAFFDLGRHSFDP